MFSRAAQRGVLGAGLGELHVTRHLFLAAVWILHRLGLDRKVAGLSLLPRAGSQRQENACLIGGDVVEEGDKVRDPLDHAQVVAGYRLQQAQERDRAAADRFGQVADHRNRRGDRVNDRLERLGVHLNLFRHRPDELTKEGGGVHVQVLVLGLAERFWIRWPRQRDQVAGVGEVESAHQGWETDQGAADPGGKAQVNVRLGLDLDLVAAGAVHQLAEGQGIAVALDVECGRHIQEGEVVVAVAAIVGATEHGAWQEAEHPVQAEGL